MPVRFAFFFCIVILFTSAGTAAQTFRFQYVQPKMGSPFNLVFYAHDSIYADVMAQAAFTLVDSLNSIYSDYIPSSELNQLSKTSGTNMFVPVSALLYNILVMSKEAGSESNRTFDITLGPLSKLWRNARKQGQFPSDAEVQEKKQLTGQDKLVIDTNTKKIKLTQQGMQLDLGGIAKGFIAQEVVNYLKSKGITSVMADAGGDIVCSDPPPGKEGWLIGINAPGESNTLLNNTLEISNQSVATSGDVYQYIERDGIKYSHIIDPGTGYGVTFQRNVTVIAPTGATADWLATACSILPLAKAKKLVRKQGAHLLISQRKGTKISVYTTKKIKKFFKSKVP